MKRLRLNKRRDPAEVMGHACIDLDWKGRSQAEYEYLPDFLEC